MQFDAPEGEYDPALHDVQFDAPKREYDPALHDIQLFGATAYVPAGHVVFVKSQLDAPEREYDPALQEVQLVDELEGE